MNVSVNKIKEHRNGQMNEKKTIHLIKEQMNMTK